MGLGAGTYVAGVQKQSLSAEMFDRAERETRRMGHNGRNKGRAFSSCPKPVERKRRQEG